MQNPNIFKSSVSRRQNSKNLACCFTKQDLKDLENTCKIVKAVGSTHFNLGTRAAFLAAVTLGNGAVLEVGEKGVGKTKVIEALENWSKGQGRKVWSKEQTMAAADEDFNDFFSNHDVLWVCYDLAKLSPTVQHGMLKVVSSIIQDRSCRVKTSLYDCDIRNSNLSWVGASVFEIYNGLWLIPEWRGSYVDRILRFYCFSYGRKTIERTTPIMPYTPNSTSINAINRGQRFNSLVSMLETQFTYERAIEYAERLLEGNVKLNHRASVTEADYKFFELFKVNIEAELLTGERETYTSPLDIDTDALFLLSECIKHKIVRIPDFNIKTKVQNKDLAYQIVEDYPNFFMRSGSLITAHPKFIRESFTPQKEFEEMCINMKFS